MQAWQLQDAKARLSEVVKRAQEAPQSITVHGKPVAVVLSQAQFEALSHARGSLVDFMRGSPLHGCEDLVLVLDRDAGPVSGRDLP